MPLLALLLLTARDALNDPEQYRDQVEAIIVRQFETGQGDIRTAAVKDAKLDFRLIRGEGPEEPPYSFGSVTFRGKPFTSPHEQVTFHPRRTYRIEFRSMVYVGSQGEVDVHFFTIGEDLHDNPHEEAWRMLPTDPNGAALKATLYYWDHVGYALVGPRRIILTSALRRLGRWEDAANMATKALDGTTDFPTEDVWTRRLEQECGVILGEVSGRPRTKLRDALARFITRRKLSG